MPRENRKRGKKHKKKAEEDVDTQQEPDAQFEDQPEAAGPSWIVSAEDRAATDPNAPFGYVDAEVKAYFRTVDVQIREWQESKPEVAVDEDVDPNEDRRLFFVAALTEMSEKERQLATDPDCSTILERMVYSMDDFVRRVFFDRLSGSFEQLSKHRFASHVFQTLLTVASETVSRESRGILPPTPESQKEEGELRTLTQLVLDACEELLPSVSTLILDPFASHVVRALLLLLAPDALASVEDANGHTGKSLGVRSKKSAAYKARQGSMKSVFTEDEDQRQKQSSRRAPKEFQKAALNIVTTLREQLGGNEIRALAANQVASPVLQILLELEATYGKADIPGSLMDHALVGVITTIHEDPNAEVPESDYLMTLLRDPTASHLLETLVRRSPERVFDILWRTYFSGKLAKLAVHPVANFVVAKAFERLDAEQLAAVVQELHGVAGKIVKNARTGVLRALVDRASILQLETQDVTELVLSAFELDLEEKSLVVPSVLRLKTVSEYKRAATSDCKGKGEEEVEESRHKRRKTEDPLEPKVPGALLLQSMLRLPSPQNDVVLNSLQAMSVDELIEMAHHPTSSRVLDAVLESPTISRGAKRKFVMTFIGHYHVLVDDRIGSRVGDRCWSSADPYLKEKIARSLVPHEHALAGSFYGKFFARNLNLHVLQRDPERWKDMQAASASNSVAAQPQAPKPLAQDNTRRPASSLAKIYGATETAKDNESVAKSKGKRKAQPQDEIDVLFDATLGKKVKRAVLADGVDMAKDEDAKSMVKKERDGDDKGKGKKEDRAGDGGMDVDKDLTDVLGAIRSAPKVEKGKGKRKRAH